MAHPHRTQASEGHNAKLRRMTENYGSADKSANKSAPTNRLKQQGPEEAVEFGADSNKPRGRSDRPSRARGGHVKAKKGGHTHVNVIVAPQGGGGAGAAPPMPMPHPMMPPPGAGAGGPPMPPPGAGGPPGMPPMAGARPPMPMPPGMPPPGMMPPRARGGKVDRASGGRLVDKNGDWLSDGSNSSPPVAARTGPRQGSDDATDRRARGGKVDHADAKQDVALIKKTLKDEGLTREKRARGGAMHAGAMSGEGRLEKIGKEPKAAGKAQVV